MHILHIDSEKDVSKINKHIEDGCHVFILVYMDGCGPCNATRPEWQKLDSALKSQYAKNNELAVIDVNKDYLANIKHIGSIDGFPTMKYIGNRGSVVESYEDSSINKKDRSVDSFIHWIENKINRAVSTTPTSSPEDVYRRLAKGKQHKPRSLYKKHTNKTHRHRRKSRSRSRSRINKKRGGKWSKKYKASINCSRPKGFSQKQHCKYGRK
jgi:hypothetical protein